jgi:hypothetical protein
MTELWLGKPVIAINTPPIGMRCAGRASALPASAAYWKNSETFQELGDLDR